jgi:hypothetical protein
VFLNQRGAEFSFSTPSAPPRPIHSKLPGVSPVLPTGTTRAQLSFDHHLLSADCQLRTTVKGACAVCSTGARKRKRLPSTV